VGEIDDVRCWLGKTDESLAYYRVGAGAYARRGGMVTRSSEQALQAQFRQMGFTTRRQRLTNWVMRGPVYRLVPQSWRRAGYRLWRRVRQ